MAAAHLSSSTALVQSRLSAATPMSVSLSPSRSVVRAAGGTKVIRKTKVVDLFVDKAGTLRNKVDDLQPQAKILTRVEELRLLTKAEKAGLLTLAERLGFSLSTIERLGLLSKAEQSGILSAVTDRQLPGLLAAVAAAALVAGPAVVYVVPEDNGVLVAAQVAALLLSTTVAATAFGASKLISGLQKF